jgi:predicted nuclease of restriction endonuclease-like (RecB) superfamily
VAGGKKMKEKITKIKSGPPLLKTDAFTGGYQCLLSEISGIITQGRSIALRQIDTTQAVTYWLVGRRIVEFYQRGADRAEYGEQVLIKLSRDLSARFGKGYSVDNLENIRRFYIGFPKMLKISETLSRKYSVPDSGTKSETVSRILSWSHYCELLKENNINARSFYEIEAVENGWSMRELRRQMDSMLYERLALSRNKKMVKALASKGQIIEKPEDAVKDPYILEFLGLKEETAYSESQLEQAVIDKLQHFLLEMGKGFTFVARQKRVTMINRHYFIDLVLYNRFLKCFVLVDFKRGEFTHADAGQMNFYLNYFRENETTEDENPPIGIILCSKKSEIYAKYVLGNLNNKIFASKYKLALPTEKELHRKLRLPHHR